MSESKVYPELKKDPPSPTSKVIDETKVIKPRAVKQDPWRVVTFDTEMCPLVRPVILKNGRAVTNVNNAAIVQLAFGRLNGDLVVPNTNINPEVENWSDLVGYTKYAEAAWGVGSGGLPAEAKRLPTFAQTILAQIYTLRTQVGKRLIIAAHNGNRWDFVVLRRQMLECGYKFPDDMDIITLDTQFILRECVQSINPKDRQWRLGYTHELLFGEPIKNWHTAAGDVQALSRIICWWASRHCPVDPTEDDITLAILRRARGLSRSELVGVSCPLPQLKRAPATPTTTTTTTTTTAPKRSLLTTLEKL